MIRRLPRSDSRWGFRFPGGHLDRGSAVVGGEVIAINDAIEADPALVNREPYDGGWFYKVKLGDVSQSAELMSPEQYDRLISQT